jgi:hypothetical protein
MRKRLVIALAVAGLACLLIGPATGRAADLLPHEVSADCTGTITTPGSGSCEATFTFDKPGYVSNVDTHGNFHELLAQPGGVRLTWFDGIGNAVWQADCISPGLYIAPLGTGPFDLQSFTCSNRTLSNTYVEGTQTLHVEATTDGCFQSPTCTFHGKISISAPDSLI